ncbi:MAG TPA: amidohydrolase family protein [Acidimicrobiia bacterium]
MAMPRGIEVIDTMIGLPTTERRDGHPASYLFGDTPEMQRAPDNIELLLAEMDRFRIARGLVPVTLGDDLHARALAEHPDRLFGSLEVDPNRGVAALRELEDAVRARRVIAAQFFPAGKTPPVPINDRRAYPLYERCVELDVPVFVQGGVPGPRVPAASQHPGLVDEVCYDFPELRFVFRHGCEPWVDLTVKLLLKWPNLFYSTTAFAPKHYPPAIVRYANTRGAAKIMFGSYYPWGFELSRIFEELDGVELRDEVWPRFLRDNAAEVLKLPA